MTSRSSTAFYFNKKYFDFASREKSTSSGVKLTGYGESALRLTQRTKSNFFNFNGVKKLGCGFVETGTVSKEEKKKTESCSIRPRLWRNGYSQFKLEKIVSNAGGSRKMGEKKHGESSSLLMDKQ